MMRSDFHVAGTRTGRLPLRLTMETHIRVASFQTTRDYKSLRDDQKEYVLHLMRSWRQVGGPFYYNPAALRRAIRKAREQRP